MREGQPQPLPIPEKALPFTPGDRAWFEKGDKKYPEPSARETGEYPGQEEIKKMDRLGQDFEAMQQALDREGATVPIRKESPAVVDAQLEAVGANLPDEEEAA